jgi:hypothetical protein
VADEPFRVFYSYSHRDERMLDRLRKHLAMLRRHGLITEWYDRNIEAGSDWREEISRELDAADVVLLLVSADFLDSDFCYEEEMQRAVDRSARGEAKVIAVMLRPVDGWETTPFAKLQVVPRDARPITSWANTDLAFSDAAAKIRSALQDHAWSRTNSDGDVPQGEAPPAPGLGADPSVAVRAGEVAAGLEELLERANVEEFLIVNGDPTRNYFTQFFAEDGAFWCEAVANEFLQAGDSLGAGQTSRLGAFGWNPPEGAIPNWWCMPDDSSPNNVAALAVRTLNEVYGVGLDAPFEIEKSWAP